MSGLKGKTISIFGNSRCAPEADEYRLAEALGRSLAENDVTVCTGGYSGVMEAASRAARQAGGQAIGITVDIFSVPPNDFLSREVRVPDLFARLKTITDLSDGFIGLRGAIGTLTEVALMWNLEVIGCLDRPKPLLLVGSCWRPIIEVCAANLAVDGRDLPHVAVVDSAEEALAWFRAYWSIK